MDGKRVDAKKGGNGKTVLCIALVVILAVALVVVGVWWGTSKNTKDNEPPQGLAQDDESGEDTAQPGQADGADVSQYANWGDDAGGRQAYSGEEIVAGVPGDGIILNSRLYEEGFLNDTRKFVRLMQIVETEDGGSQAVLCDENTVIVEEGIYLVNVYVQNDIPGTVSEDTRVGIGIPMEHGLSMKVSGWIASGNAEISELWHEITLESEKPFSLEYVYGSALLWRKGLEDEGVFQLPDAIVTKVQSEKGTPVGWEELNGELPGGEEYLVTAQIAIRVIYDEVTE